MFHLTPTQLKLIELDKKKEEVKKYYEELAQTLEELVKQNGLNSMFMDQDGIVYKVIKPEGRFIPYENHAYVRTKRSGEERGSLSLKEAKERGFDVK